MMAIKNTLVVAVVGLIGSLGNAKDCNLSSVTEDAKKVATYYFQEEGLTSSSENEVAVQSIEVLSPGSSLNDVGASSEVGQAVATVVVASSIKSNGKAIQTGQIEVRVYNDLIHTCEVRVYSKKALSAYELCREVNGYNGRVGNPYDPCVN